MQKKITPFLHLFIAFLFFSLPCFSSTGSDPVYSSNRKLNDRANQFRSQLQKYNEIDSNKRVLILSESCIRFARLNDLAELEAFALGKKSSVYRRIGEIDKAFVIARQIFKLGEKNKDKYILIEANRNMGRLLLELDQPQNGLNHFKTAAQYYKELKETSGKPYFDLLSNIGTTYREMPHKSLKDLDTAKSYFQQVINFYTGEPAYRLSLADAYMNFGSVYLIFYNQLFSKRDLIVALNYNKRAFTIFKELDNKERMGKVQTNSAISYYNLEDYPKSLAYFSEAEVYAKEAGDLRTLVVIYDYMRYLHELKKDFSTAYIYREKWVGISDSLNELENAKTAEDLQVKYETDSKEQQISMLEKDKKIQGKDLEKQKAVRNSLIGGFALVALFAVILGNRFVITRRQTRIIAMQKSIVDHKNKDITDSINYAKRIQTALLKGEEVASDSLYDYFILFRPKDIVSGDFYWTIEKQNHFYMCVADCTGHGVPGAFLTMLGTSYLNEINSTEELLTPAEILDQLRSRFIRELSQSGKEGQSKDGMDISMVRIDLDTLELQWAGANNPLWIVRNTATHPPFEALELTHIKMRSNNTLLTIIPDKQPIGYADNLRPFRNHTLQLLKDDSVYIFSDGFADQFGGPKGKKLKSSVMKESLLSLQSASLIEQREMLEALFDTWKQSLEQVDDVCVVGIRIDG